MAKFWDRHYRLGLDESNGQKQCLYCAMVIQDELPMINVFQDGAFFHFHTDCLVNMVLNAVEVVHVNHIFGQGNLDIEDVEYLVGRINEVLKVMHGGSCTKYLEPALECNDALGRDERYLQEYRQNQAAFMQKYKSNYAWILDASALAGTRGFSKQKRVKLSCRRQVPQGETDYNSFVVFCEACRRVSIRESVGDKMKWFNSLLSRKEFNGDLYTWLKLLVPALSGRGAVLSREQVLEICSDILRQDAERVQKIANKQGLPRALRQVFADPKQDIIWPKHESTLTIHQVDAFASEIGNAIKVNSGQIKRAMKRMMAMCTPQELEVILHCLVDSTVVEFLGIPGIGFMLMAFHADACRFIKQLPDQMDKLKELAYHLHNDH